MSRKKIVIFTKKNWNEPPRIRHQLTRLLSSYGQEIMLGSRNFDWQVWRWLNFIRWAKLFDVEFS